MRRESAANKREDTLEIARFQTRPHHVNYLLERLKMLWLVSGPIPTNFPVPGCLSGECAWENACELNSEVPNQATASQS